MELGTIVALVWIPVIAALLVNPIRILVYQILFLGLWLPPLLLGWLPLNLEAHDLDNLLLLFQLTPI